jgi:hypothetical protein
MEINLNGGVPGPFLMSKADFDRIGGVPLMNSGEDQAFRHVAEENGLRFIETKRTSYVYRWCTGNYHISAIGSEEEGWDKVEKVVEHHMQINYEPKGLVKLHPHWEKDYVLLCEKCPKK